MHGLIAGNKINNAETPVPQHTVIECSNGFPVRAPVTDRISHLLYHRAESSYIISCYPGYSTHENFVLSNLDRFQPCNEFFYTCGERICVKKFNRGISILCPCSLNNLVCKITKI